MMEPADHERFRDAVERKKEASRRASEQPPPEASSGSAVPGEEQSPLTESGRPQDVRDPRKKNSRHRKQTADKT